MKRISILILAHCAFAHENALAKPAHPCVIVTILAGVEIPRISINEPTTLKQTLDFIYHKYRDNLETDGLPEESFAFVFEYRLPEATLQRHVSLEAKNITMTKAIQLAFKDIPMVLTFESGKVIFSEPAAPDTAHSSDAKP